MTTILHFLFWTGMAIIGLGCAFGLYIVALGVKDRLSPESDADEDDDYEPIIPSQFAPYVPGQQHRTWSDVKDERNETEGDR